LAFQKPKPIYKKDLDEYKLPAFQPQKEDAKFLAENAPNASTMLMFKEKETVTILRTTHKMRDK
jgi:hypothetical protein